MYHIKEIAKEPHSIFDDKAHDEVRDYLLGELKKLGVEVKTYKYEDVYIERTKTNEDIENIYGEIKGKNDSYIMLVTHYDSSRAKKECYAEVDGSVGAADAGYGLVGVKEAVKNNEIFENVNYLINLEARGTKGHAIMFETSPNNSKIVDLYTKSEKLFSYSIIPEIYRLLPNGTDFTVFLENDIPGINISVLDGLENYHTPNDSIESVNENSIQHYGDQVLPIVTEFVSNEKYKTSDALSSEEDSIFFIIGNVFVKYSKFINYCLLAIILVCIVLLYRRFNIKRVLSPLKYTLIKLGYILFVAGASYGISRIVAVINKRPYKITYLPIIKYEYVIILAVLAVAIIGYILLMRRVSNKFKYKNEYILGSIILLFVLGLLLTFVLPGGSYLFVFPALLISIFTVLVDVMKVKNKSIVYSLFIPISLITILYIPTVYLFNCALTLGALCATMIFAMMAIISVTSCYVQID